MSEVKKIATRESYGHALVELGKEHEEVVVLDADLAEATKTGIFKKEFSERHIDCGIAECNMMGIAAGLAATGKVPFASSFAMFAAGRAFEQIRNSIGYPHLNVKIGATHAGISVGDKLVFGTDGLLAKSADVTGYKVYFEVTKKTAYMGKGVLVVVRVQ